MFSDYMIRPCGNDYQYCDGHCAACDRQSMVYGTTTTTNTEPDTYTYRAFTEDDGLSKPSLEQYEASKAAKQSLGEWIRHSKKRQEDLLDDLVKEREVEKGYRGMYDAHCEVIRRYEIYEELANNG